MKWMPEQTKTLTALWTEGLSASEIAKQIGGITRNAVIGKVHRLGLAERSTARRVPRRAGLHAIEPPRLSRRTHGPPRPPRVSEPVHPIVDLPALGDAPATPVTVLTLRRGVCHWPEGDPKDPAFQFCGRAADGIYCAHHVRRAYPRPDAQH